MALGDVWTIRRSARWAVLTVSAVAVLGLVLALGAARLAVAAPAGTQLTLKGPPSATSGDRFEVVATLRHDGAPVEGAEVRLERQAGDTWVPEATSVTDDAGSATFVLAHDESTAPSTLRVVHDGGQTAPAATSDPLTVALAETASRVSVLGPGRGVIGLEATLRARLLTLVAEARRSGADPEQELRDAVRSLIRSASLD